MLRTTLISTVLAIVIGGSLADPAAGQWRGQSRFGRPSPPTIDPNVILRRLDANGDGALSPSEIPAGARPLIQRAAEHAKLDTSEPVSIERLVTAIRELRDSGTGGSSSSAKDAKSSGGSRSSSEGAAVPGFGVEQDLPAVPGFGPDPSGATLSGPLEDHFESRVIEYVNRIFYRYDKNKNDILDGEEWKEISWRSDPKQSDTNGDGKLSKAEFCERMVKHWSWGRKQASSADQASSSTSRGFGSSGGSSDSASKSGSGDSSAKVRTYAKSLLTQYDKNKNGVLEKEEWSQMKSKYAEADTNGNGTITLDELTIKLSSYGYGSSSGGSTSGSSAPSRSSSSPSRSYSGSSRTSGQGTYRFKSPTERLPRGLPDWFARSDTNADGQVAMSEYSATWSDTKAGEFQRFDLNKDGFVTPQECLAAEEDE